MPQVRGAANWLTNVRQPIPNKRAVYCDDSRARIENGHLDKAVDKKIDTIQQARHRKLADRLFELKQTKQDVKHYERLQTIIQNNNVQKALDKKPTHHHQGTVRQVTIPLNNDSHPKFLLVASGSNLVSSNNLHRPKTTTGTFQSGFTKVNVDYDSDDDHYATVHRPRTRTPSPERQTGSQSKLRALTALPRHKQRRSRREILATVEHHDNPRPNTSQALMRPETSASRHSEAESVSQIIGRKVPGRSFQELRSLTNVDQINYSCESVQREAVMLKRDEELQEQQEELQSKIEVFYLKLDQFKQKQNPVKDRKITVFKAQIYF